MKSNKYISQKIFFDQIPFFAISKMAKNPFLNWGKSLKLPKMQFHEECFDLFQNFTSFLPGLFKILLAAVARFRFRLYMSPSALLAIRIINRRKKY